MKTEATIENLREALKTVLKYASADEGQSWHIEFNISEHLYGTWEDLANGES